MMINRRGGSRSGAGMKPGGKKSKLKKYPKQQFSTRIHPRIIAIIKDEAEKESIPIAQFIERLVINHIKQ